MALETSLASKHMKKEQTPDIAALYNKYAVKDLNTLLPDFDWRTFLQASDVAKQDSIVITQVEYTKSLNTILKTTPLDTWKMYLTWGLFTGRHKC